MTQVFTENHLRTDFSGPGKQGCVQVLSLVPNNPFSLHIYISLKIFSNSSPFPLLLGTLPSAYSFFIFLRGVSLGCH